MGTTWRAGESARIGDAAELSSRAPDGTLRPYVTMWIVRAGDDLYVRSAYGARNPCYVRPSAPVAAASAPQHGARRYVRRSGRGRACRH